MLGIMGSDMLGLGSGLLGSNATGNPSYASALPGVGTMLGGGSGNRANAGFMGMDQGSLGDQGMGIQHPSAYPEQTYVTGPGLVSSYQPRVGQYAPQQQPDPAQAQSGVDGGASGGDQQLLELFGLGGGKNATGNAVGTALGFPGAGTLLSKGGIGQLGGMLGGLLGGGGGGGGSILGGLL